jgi:phosphodiester glycosidase
MLRRVLTSALAAATIGVPAATASAPLRGQTLMPGVVYSKQVQLTAHGPVVLNVASTPRPGGLYGVHALLSNGAVQGRQRLTDMEKDLSPTTTAVGVDGDFFSTRWGSPSSALIRGGVLTTQPQGGRSVAGFDAAGDLHVDRLTLSGFWKGTGQNWALGLNAPPPTAKSAATLYTPAWGPTTPPESGTTEVVLAPFPSTRPNVTLAAPVVSVAQGGGQPIPADGAVIAARGTMAKNLTAEAPVGTVMNVRLILTPPWGDIVEAVGGGPVLVRNGRAVFRSNETFTSAQLLRRLPRSAVGQTADGRLLLVSVDGGRPGWSTGMTSFELARAMQRLGAVDASALGTGSYAALAFDGKLLSRPSGAAEGSISDALVVTYDGVYALAPPATVAAGKPVTLAYKVVRPSTVTATLTGPDGSTTTVDAATRSPGTYRVSWTATTTGRWTFTVSARDDLGRSSSADRTFTVGSSTRRG